MIKAGDSSLTSLHKGSLAIKLTWTKDDDIEKDKRGGGDREGDNEVVGGGTCLFVPIMYN